MSELKTLKDFGESNDFKNTDIYTDLRAEAIKWVREIKKKREMMIRNGLSSNWTVKSETSVNVGPTYVSWNPDEDESYGVCGFIKHFFNITEEELKLGPE